MTPSGDEFYCSAYTIKLYGYLQRTSAIERLENGLFQFKPEKRHITFIEKKNWLDCTVEDGMFVSRARFHMEKTEFNEFINKATQLLPMQTHSKRSKSELFTG
jgi:hypothetical protein